MITDVLDVIRSPQRLPLGPFGRLHYANVPQDDGDHRGWVCIRYHPASS